MICDQMTDVKVRAKIRFYDANMVVRQEEVLLI